ncbi:MAG: hypothetical protein WC477_07685 [Patescibacteria group bacterium]
MSDERFDVERPTQAEYEALATFLKNPQGYGRLISKIIAWEILKLDSIQSIDRQQDPIKVSEDVNAIGRAHIRLVEIFNELGFDMSGNQIFQTRKEKRHVR